MVAVASDTVVVINPLVFRDSVRGDNRHQEFRPLQRIQKYGAVAL